MSLVLGILIRDYFGNREIIFASDGRAIAHDTKKVRSEDVEKIRKLTPKICMGYGGHSGELYQDVYNELIKKMRKMMVKNLLFVSSKLRTVIIEMLKKKIHKEHEKIYGPLYHKFIIGGIYNRELIINVLETKNNYQTEIHKLPLWKNISIITAVPSQEIFEKVKGIVEEKLGHQQSFDEVVENIRYVISKAAERHPGINDHIFIRRHSRNFELEKYSGYE